MDYQLFIFIVFVVAAITYGLFFPLKCPKCLIKLKFEMITDTWGINITKNFIIRAKRYGGSDSYYTCPKCNKHFLQKKNSSQLEEIEKIPDRFIVFK